MGSLALDLMSALDPVAFAQDKLDFEPDPWQANLLRSTSNQVLLNCCRQSGKSTTTAIKALHTATYSPGSLILLGSPSQRQSSLLFSKVTEFRKRMNNGLKLQEDNRTSFELSNGSRVVCLPGSADTVRGFSAPSLIIEDEAAFVDDGFNIAIRPMLAVSQGRLILMSTPNGRRGHFYEAWENGGDDWDRIEVTAEDCPRITEEHLQKERRTYGEWTFLQEYECKFMDAANQLFRTSDIDRAITDEVKPLFFGSTNVKPLEFEEVS